MCFSYPETMDDLAVPSHKDDRCHRIHNYLGLWEATTPIVLGKVNVRQRVLAIYSAWRLVGTVAPSIPMDGIGNSRLSSCVPMRSCGLAVTNALSV